jgi:hypothetical protein
MSRSRSTILFSAVADLGLVLVFVAIGRSSHREGASLLGFLDTAWPFVAGLIVGWIALRAWRHPTAVVWTGWGVWAITVVVGIALRALSGQGIAVSFIVVTAIVVAVFLVGWRAIVVGTRRYRSAASSPARPR